MPLDRRPLALATSLALSAMLLPSAASAGDARTTRIETRPFYGATVTLEHGVRVFRPLPPHERVIINPHGKTPLNLSYEQHKSTSHNYYYGNGPSGADTSARPDGGYAYGGPIYGGYGYHKRPRGHGVGGMPAGGHHRVYGHHGHRAHGHGHRGHGHGGGKR